MQGLVFCDCTKLLALARSFVQIELHLSLRNGECTKVDRTYTSGYSSIRSIFNRQGVGVPTGHVGINGLKGYDVVLLGTCGFDALLRIEDLPSITENPEKQLGNARYATNADCRQELDIVVIHVETTPGKDPDGR
jgi:hypothetical protein